MKKILLGFIVTIAFQSSSNAQPFALGINNVDGNPFTCTLLEDLGIYKRLRVQATQHSSSATWEFPALCTFPGDVWRPYTSGTPPIPFNAVIPPIPNTAAALYNSGNGGASGNLSPVTMGRYYTFNVENIFTPTGSPHICVLETETFPVAIQTVTQSPVSSSVGANDPVTVTVTCSSAPVENVFVRYTTNGFSSTTIVPISFTGNTGTAVIPGFPFGTTVVYYVYSSPKSKAAIDAEAVLYGEIVHDMSTLDWNTNNASNYTYTVTTVVPLQLEYFRGFASARGNELDWKMDCSNSGNITVTLERSSGNSGFSSIYAIRANEDRCLRPFHVTDDQAPDDIVLYRIRMENALGRSSYSPVLSLKNNQSNLEAITVLPSIIENGIAFLQVYCKQATTSDVVITDLSGKTVYRNNYSLSTGTNQIRLDVNALNPGMYVVFLSDKNGRRKPVQFIKR